MANKTKISDLDTKIIALLHRREKKDNSGFGTFLIQRKINKSGTKKYSHNDIVDSIDSLNQKGLLKYDDTDFWVLTDKGRLYSEECEEQISGYVGLMIKLYN